MFSLRDLLLNYLQLDNDIDIIVVDGNNVNIIDYLLYMVKYNIVNLFFTTTVEEYDRFISDTIIEITLLENNTDDFIKITKDEGGVFISLGVNDDEIGIDLSDFINTLQTNEQKQYIVDELIYIFNKTLNKNNNLLDVEDIFEYDDDDGDIVLNENISIEYMHKLFKRLEKYNGLIFNNLTETNIKTNTQDTTKYVYDLDVEYVLNF